MQMKQMEMFIDEPLEASNDNAKDDNWEARFHAYHTANPHVYELVKKYTKDVIKTGRKTFSMTSIFERIRWYTNIETTGDEFKINQNYIPHYSRMFMREHPEHDGFFNTRKLRSKNHA